MGDWLKPEEGDFSPLILNFRNANTMKKEELLIELNNVLAIQGNSGNWNHDPYMHGMFNGMELMMSIIEEREPLFNEAPETYLIDNHSRPDNDEKLLAHCLNCNHVNVITKRFIVTRTRQIAICLHCKNCGILF